MEKSNIWYFPKSIHCNAFLEEIGCVGATDRNHLGTDPTMPTSLDGQMTPPLTSRIEKEIGPTL